MADFERLDAAITHAVENPERFDFGSWFARTNCGTTACLAGTVAWQDGWTPVFNRASADAPLALADDVEKDGEVRYTFDLARDLLGLTEEQAEDMFVQAGGVKGVIEERNRLAATADLPERTWAVAK